MIGEEVGLRNVVEDLTPQFGGAVDVNDQEIVSVGNGDIVLDPDGTGDIRLGDSTNNTTIDSDGAVTFHGSATVWDDLRITPGAFTFVGASDPTLSDWQPDGTGATFKVWKFQENNEVFVTAQMPHSYKEGTDLGFHIHWTPCDRGDDEGTAEVAWKIDYSFANIGSNFPESETADLTDECAGVDDRHEMTDDVPVDGSGLTTSHIIMMRVYRSADGDTWTGTTAPQSPALLEIDIHYEIDTIGSRQSSHVK